MNSINAIIRNGRIETDDPISLPDGTKLVVFPADASVDDRDAEELSQSDPSWLKWFDSLEPLVFTPDERAALEKDRAERKAWELAHADERDEALRRLWR